MSESVSSPSTAPVSEGNSSETVTNENPAPEAAPAPKAIKRYIEIDGERVEEDALKRDYKKYRSADAKFREASEARKQVDQFMEALMADPETVLNDPRLSIDRKKLGEKWLLDVLTKEMAPHDPKQAELDAYRKKLAEYEAKEKEAQDKDKQAELSKRIERRREEIASVFQKAIELSPLSKDQGTAAEVVREMATYMRICNQNGYDVTPAELAQHVESRFTKSYQTLVQNMDGDDLVAFLGKDVIKKLRKYDLGQIQASRAAKSPVTEEQWAPSDRSAPRDFTDPRKLKGTRN